ncbi:hypothetical protein LTR85_006804 [Meristemomyces frigidus]|nr:hypothetical protein LTR85_006804 [Meristemomyces frigidus]
MKFDPYCDGKDEKVLEMEMGEADEPPLSASAFLRLPGELRVCIYRYALLKTDNIKIGKHEKPAQPGILQVNTQCRNESADIYYEENAFAFHVTHFDAAL